MGELPRLADLYKISREEQDAYALESQRRAGVAIGEGRFRGDRSVTVPGEKVNRGR
jgi:acetyl-CoA C-acetyltransferase